MNVELMHLICVFIYLEIIILKHYVNDKMHIEIEKDETKMK